MSMETKQVKAYMKARRKNEFYAKRVRGGYYAVTDGYDMSMESLEVSEEAAAALIRKLNQLRNER